MWLHGEIRAGLGRQAHDDFDSPAHVLEQIAHGGAGGACADPDQRETRQGATIALSRPVVTFTRDAPAGLSSIRPSALSMRQAYCPRVLVYLPQDYALGTL